MDNIEEKKGAFSYTSLDFSFTDICTSHLKM